MGTTARHRGNRRGMRSRLSDAAWRRHSLAAVCGLVVVSVLGYSSQPVRGIDAQPDGSPMADGGVRAAMMASAPGAHLRPVIASVTEPEYPAATGAGDEGDIPGPALAAYQRAASVMDEAAPACELSWTLLAGVGRVESDHGRYGAAVLGSDGVSSPRIVGVALDGTGRVAALSDTDDGELDGDDVWDRAVGPMQFLPTTWALAGVDGDGDGVRNPHDLDDAALAAGVYLCAGGGNLSAPQDLRAALLRYNPSASYAALVMAYEQRYRTGRFAADSGPVLTSAIVSVGRRPAGASAEVRTTKGPAPEPAREPEPAGEPAPDLGPAPVPAPAPAPRVDVDQATQPDAARQPVPDPAPDPAPEPSPDPQDTDPDASTPDAPGPDRHTVTGVWTECDDGFCFDEIPLLLGDPELLDQLSDDDYDGDGEVTDYVTELVGLVDTTVVVVVDKQETGWVVYSINDLAYPATSPGGAEAAIQPRS